MAQLSYDKVKLIVESNLRSAGLEGVYENGWKDSVDTQGQTFQQPFNLQGLRDVIAKSIVDAMTDPTVGGSPSIGNIQGNPAVVQDTSTININVGTASKEAVRVGDETKITSVTDSKFIAWVNAVNAFISACAGCTSGSTASAVGTASVAYTTAGATVGGFPPSEATGEATKGSSTVKIGD